MKNAVRPPEPQPRTQIMRLQITVTYSTIDTPAALAGVLTHAAEYLAASGLLSHPAAEVLDTTREVIVGKSY